jgi:hypothetical protein
VPLTNTTLSVVYERGVRTPYETMAIAIVDVGGE